MLTMELVAKIQQLVHEDKKIYREIRLSIPLYSQADHPDPNRIYQPNG